MNFFDTLNISDTYNANCLSIELSKVNVFIGTSLSGIHLMFDKAFEYSDNKLPKVINFKPTDEDLSYVRDIAKKLFYPMLRDIKRYEDNNCMFQSSYDDNWYTSQAVTYVCVTFFSLLCPEAKGYPLLDNNFGSWLDPRSARKFLEEVIKAAEINERQLIILTCQPNVLDALDLNNDEHRLFVVGTNPNYSCKVTRIKPFKPLEGQETTRLSEAWLRGHIGGLSKGF